MLRMRQICHGWRTFSPLIAIAMITGLIGLFLDVQPIGAQGTEIQAALQRANWQARYWNNTELAGAPAVDRMESVLNYDWGTGSPSAMIQSDNFSARWVCTVQMSAGQYHFRTASDDGIRVYLDDRLIINEWYEHAEQVNTAQLYVSDGQHTIRVDYFEKTGVAVARLYWYRIAEPQRDWPRGDDWRGEYYNNRSLAGSPAFARYDNAIDFNWGSGSPDGRIDDDNFAIRWERTLYFCEDDYRFIVYSDDGVRLYINGERKIDAWYDMSVTRHTYETHLAAGDYTIRLEYYEHVGAAQIEFYWSRIRDTERPVGNIITCAPPQPYNYAWINIYTAVEMGTGVLTRGRNSGSHSERSIASRCQCLWGAMTPKGIGAINGTGYLKVDGLPVDVSRYGGSDHPYCVELWVNGQMIASVGNTDRGEPEFRVYADRDNYICSPYLSG